ncbi:hypothetical protein DFS34DRAFT_666381 [Phlyctochytrium arcticum]|nr:hypothetical protein DFS34DRAFT_666381 [Phlyctochytrium arcticum]
MTILPGTGIIVAGSPGGPYTISSIDTFTQKKAADNPPEQKTASDTPEVFKSGSGSTVAVTGGMAGALSGGIASLGGVSGGGSFITGIASSAIGGISQLAGALSGGSLIGGFIGLWGHERKQEKDVNGDLLFDPVNGTPLLEEGSNVVIATFPDSLGCDTTRLLFDKPPLCSWLGLQNEYCQQAVNLQILREYDAEIILPKIVSTTSELVQPLQDAVDMNTALITGLEEDIFNNYQAKITSENQLSYDLLQNSPNLSGFATNSSVSANYVSNTSLSTTLTGYVSNTSFGTGMLSKQNIINAGNKIDFSFLTNFPSFVLQITYDTRQTIINNLLGTKVEKSVYDTRQTSIDASIATKVEKSVYDTRQTTIDNLLGTKVEKVVYDTRQTAIDTLIATKQPLLSSSVKLDYSFISNGPDLAPFLTRTTDLNSINASIATKVEKSVYDNRQTTIDNLLGTKVEKVVYDIRQSVIDTALSGKQSTISNSLSLSGVDATLTNLLTDNFTIAPNGVLTGNAVYDSINKWGVIGL